MDSSREGNAPDGNTMAITGRCVCRTLSYPSPWIARLVLSENRRRPGSRSHALRLPHIIVASAGIGQRIRHLATPGSNDPVYRASAYIETNVGDAIRTL